MASFAEALKPLTRLLIRDFIIDQANQLKNIRSLPARRRPRSGAHEQH